MPMLEKRMKRNYLEARYFGESGGNCESYNTNCALPIEYFDNLIDHVKNIF